MRPDKRNKTKRPSLCSIDSRAITGGKNVITPIQREKPPLFTASDQFERNHPEGIKCINREDLPSCNLKSENRNLSNNVFFGVVKMSWLFSE